MSLYEKLIQYNFLHFFFNQSTVAACFQKNMTGAMTQPGTRHKLAQTYPSPQKSMLAYKLRVNMRGQHHFCLILVNLSLK